MTPKEKYQKSLETADLSVEDWEGDVVNAIENDYARGYIAAKIEAFDSWCISQKSKRAYMYDYINYSIWD